MLRQTLLPVPVRPAIKRCGIFVRSTTTGRPLTSLPEEQRNPHFVDRVGARFDQFAEANENLFLVRHFHADRVLARNRRDEADRPEREAQSPDRRPARRPWTAADPASSSSSNWVTTGPVSISTTRTFRLKSLKVFSRTTAGGLSLRGQRLVGEVFGRPRAGRATATRRDHRTRRRFPASSRSTTSLPQRLGFDRRIHLDRQTVRTARSPRFGGFGRGGLRRLRHSRRRFPRAR